MNISRRLDTIACMVGKCRVLADIGCDHGYVAIESVRSGRAEHVIAADVASGPLEAARKNAAAEGMAGDMDFIISDGFKALHGIQPEPECAVIAGMGGILTANILREGRLCEFGGLKQLILSPHSDIDLVRRFIRKESDYDIIREKVLCDDGKYYFIMDARRSDGTSEFRDNDAVNADAAVDSAAHQTATIIEHHFEGYDAKAGSISGDDGTGRTVTDEYSEYEYLYGRNIDADSLDCYREYLNHRRESLSAARSSAAAGNSERSQSKAAELDIQISYIDQALAAVRDK